MIHIENYRAFLKGEDEVVNSKDLYQTLNTRYVYLPYLQELVKEVDNADKDAYHIWLEDEEGIQAYARILPPGTTFEEASIGRIIAKKRRCGLGTQIVKEAIKTAKEEIQRKINQNRSIGICKRII